MKPPTTTLDPFTPIGQSTLLEQHRRKGPGPIPAKWRADDGTIVYRSYADYCDD